MSCGRQLAGAFGDRRSEGHWLVSLARFVPVDEALPLIERGEGPLRESGDPIVLAIALAIKAGVLFEAGDTVAAELSLAEAEAVAPDGNIDSADALNFARDRRPSG